MDLADENLTYSSPPTPSSSLPIHLISDLNTPLSPPTIFFRLLLIFHHRQPHRINHIILLHPTISPHTHPPHVLIVPYSTVSPRKIHLKYQLCSLHPHRNQRSSPSSLTLLATQLISRYQRRESSRHLVSLSNVIPITTVSSSSHALYPPHPPMYPTGDPH